MAARTEAETYATPKRPERAVEAGPRPSTVTAEDVRGHHAFHSLLAFRPPEAEGVRHLDEAGAVALQIQSSDGSWARVALVGGDPGLRSSFARQVRLCLAHSRRDPAGPARPYVNKAS